MDSLSSLFFFIAMLPSAIFHEFMHGWVADRLGDPTARYAGRLTLNPIPHIDPIGTILLPLLLYFSSGGRFMFAYAKPVPYNPYNLKNQRWGPVLVAIAGPLSNFTLAAAFGLAMRFVPDGSMLPAFLSIIVYANVMLGVFNLVPIPPLDGSKVLFAVLPRSLDALKDMLERYGFILVLIFSTMFFGLLRPLITALYSFFVGGDF